ncbi:hypothetical protein ACFFP0_21490 [Rhizobium puerariae]|uniref:Uncharacterized protein n=1 Tax=Rhizobium puerariae TaxID=1585791 RepID=A0ABV6ALD6_9HYPH
MKTQSALAAILAVLGLTAAHASSDDAWSEFRAEVDKACLAAAKGLIENGKALVDPFGSESYGLAVVSGKSAGAKATISAICVFDKKTKKAEIGGEIAGDELLMKTGK